MLAGRKVGDFSGADPTCVPGRNFWSGDPEKSDSWGQGCLIYFGWQVKSKIAPPNFKTKHVVTLWTPNRLTCITQFINIILINLHLQYNRKMKTAKIIQLQFYSFSEHFKFLYGNWPIKNFGNKLCRVFKKK